MIETDYGIGWKTECTFSDLKRLSGDMVTVRRPERTALELFQKVRTHSFCKDLPAELKKDYPTQYRACKASGQWSERKFGKVFIPLITASA